MRRLAENHFDELKVSNDTIQWLVFFAMPYLMCVWCVCRNFHLYANPEIAMFLCYLHAEAKTRFGLLYMCDNRCSQMIRTKLVFVRSQHVVYVVDHNSDKNSVCLWLWHYFFLVRSVCFRSPREPVHFEFQLGLEKTVKQFQNYNWH